MLTGFWWPGGGGEPQGCSLEVLRAVSEMQVLRFHL